MSRSNHRTKVSRFTWLTVIVAVGFGFELKCPEPSQWVFRKHKCVTPEKYSCLYNIKRKQYVESCFEKADFVKAGKRYIRWGGRDSYNCSDSRYQPRKFWSNVTSDCETQKSNCCEEGQVAMNYGSTTEDRACRCDNRNGFASITTHKDVCSCIPSQEDCSCYRTKFAEGGILITKEKDCGNMTNMLEAGEKCLSAVGSELKVPESTFLSENSRTSYNLYRQGRIELIALFLGIIVVACAVTRVAFCWEEELDFKLMFLCGGEIREAMKDKDLYAKKVISNWKYIKGAMVCSDVMKELSAYRFINFDSLKKQQLFLKYPKDCILKFIVDRSYEIVNNIHWYDAREDILFQILQRPVVETKCDQHIDKDKQGKHLSTYRKKLLKNVHIEDDDIIDDFVQKFIFELSDMETIRSNSSEMNTQFIEKIIDTLENGSYQLWLDIAKKRGTCYSAIFNILNELEEDEIIRPSVEVTLEHAELHIGDADNVKEVLFDISIVNCETQAIHSPSQEIIPCAISFVQVLGLFPKVQTVATTGVKLDVICNNVLDRIEHNIKKGTFNNLVKKICNQHELETGSYVLEITCSVEKEDFNAHYPDTDMLPGTPMHIIQANRAFLVKEFDVDIIAESLCNEIDEEYKMKIRKEENRKAKANIICDVFLQNKSPSSLKKLFDILEKENMSVALTRLQKCQDIFSYSKGTEHLRNAIITNFDQIVSKLSQNHLIRVAFIQLLKERDILKEDFEDETEIGNVLVFVMQEGMFAMLHIVDALHALKLKDLAETILCCENASYRCTAGDDKIKGKLCRKQLPNGILLKAVFKVMVEPNAVL